MLVHIGYPKCASTSLQQAFSKMEGLQFLGCNPKESPGDYYAPEIGSFFENELRLAPDDVFQRRSDAVQSFMMEQDTLHEGRVLVSYENLCFRLSPWDLPTDVKLCRLSKVLPTRPTFIVIYRPISELLLSLYKNYLTVGYTATFAEFCAEILALGDVGIFGDLDLKRLHRRINQNFSEADMHFFALNDAQQGLGRVFDALNLTLPVLEFENQGMSDDQVQSALVYNKNMPTRKRFLDWLEVHRVLSDAHMDEGDIFYLSRFRHAQMDALQKMERQNLEVSYPSEILDLEASNIAFIKEFRKGSLRS